MKLLRALCIIWCFAELFLTRRSGPGATSKDRGTLRLLWVVEITSLVIGVLIAGHFRASAWRWFYLAGVCIFTAGLLLRLYAIIYLGRFFTINVAIAADHHLIDTGPYRFIRHPSYTGALLIFLGLGLAMGNWASPLVIIIPIFWAFSWRMSVEEAALCEALGEPYRAYMKRTRRLIPMIY